MANHSYIIVIRDVVMLGREFLIEQKECCGSGCFLCPYIPKHKAGSKKIDKRFKDIKLKE